MGGKGCGRLSDLRDGVFGMHARGSGGRARGALVPFAYSSFNFHGLNRGGEGVSEIRTLSGGSLSMHTSGSEE